MEEVRMVKEIPHPQLFNSRLETGARALTVLDAAYPSVFDLAHLVWFDHLVVHTGDIGGPESLHPAVPHRSGELLVRRRLIEEGLTLMRRFHFVKTVTDEAGIAYQSTEEAASLVELMRSKYGRALRARSQWLAENVCGLERGKLKELIATTIGKWSVEFQGETEIGRLSR
jgi:hypothetical protein